MLDFEHEGYLVVGMYWKTLMQSHWYLDVQKQELALTKGISCQNLYVASNVYMKHAGIGVTPKVFLFPPSPFFGELLDRPHKRSSIANSYCTNDPVYIHGGVNRTPMA